MQDANAASLASDKSSSQKSDFQPSPRQGETRSRPDLSWRATWHLLVLLGIINFPMMCRCSSGGSAVRGRGIKRARSGEVGEESLIETLPVSLDHDLNRHPCNTVSRDSFLLSSKPVRPLDFCWLVSPCQPGTVAMALEVGRGGFRREVSQLASNPVQTGRRSKKDDRRLKGRW